MAPIDSLLTADLSVLLVDDQPAGLKLLEAQVRALGFERVLTAGGGAEALEQVRACQPNIVITDLMMPEIDGAQLLDEIKRQNPEIAVLLLSAVDSLPRAVELLKRGAADYLTKPTAIDVLATRLEVVAERLVLRREAAELAQVVDQAFHLPEGFVWGSSEAMLRVASRIPALARTDAAVIVLGESGSGKELIARTIHSASRRAGGALVAISCASIPDGLWEREFFGHVKGAFSDAGDGGDGVIAVANGGTLFLDEVGEIPLPVQAKLLRFLQEKEYRPVGSTVTLRADVRIVSATNCDLQEEVAAGRFREDLYYRLNVLPLRLPPLRERKEDIPALASFFLRRYADAFGAKAVAFSPLALQKLCSYDFPGNVRELENRVQQALVETRRTVVCADDVPVGDPTITERRPDEAAALPEVVAPASAEHVDLPYNEAKQLVVESFERRYVQALLATHGGNVSKAAVAAGLPRRSLARIIARHGLSSETGAPGRPPNAVS